LRTGRGRERPPPTSGSLRILRRSRAVCFCHNDGFAGGIHCDGIDVAEVGTFRGEQPLSADPLHGIAGDRYSGLAENRLDLAFECLVLALADSSHEGFMACVLPLRRPAKMSSVQ
jgi:hypothetical protein